MSVTTISVAERVGDLARRPEELGIGGIGERVRVELGVGLPIPHGDEQVAVDFEEVRRRPHDAHQLRGAQVRPRDVEDADARRARDIEEVAVADHVRRARDCGLTQQAQAPGIACWLAMVSVSVTVLAPGATTSGQPRGWR